ncbi:hypothetical protein FSP39_022808, partial [Pinctada imbricata]
PQFLNLPASVDIHEATSVETLLYNISVIDQSGNDTVSCSISSTTPTSAPFIVKYRTGTSATISVSSVTAVGTVIYEVNASDAEGDPLSYSIQGCGSCAVQITQGGQIILRTSIASVQQYSYAFYIRVADGTTTSQEVLAVIINAGAVTLIEAVDYESNLTQFAITFDVTDGKNAATPGTLTINVLDINEPPEFERTIYYTTHDECCNGREFSVAGFTVTDPDGDTFHYDFAPGGDDHHRFQISATTGRIRYQVDYDIDSPTNMPADLVFIIGAVDARGQTGTTSLIVTITDRAEHSPEFAESLYTTTIYNDHQVSSAVFYVSATDKDYGPTCNALTYILFGQTDYFAISNDGLIRTTTPLESIVNDTVLSFVVQATDGCGSSTNVSVEVTIVPGTTTGFFDNTSNIAYFVGGLAGAGLVILGISFVIFRMVKHGYVFRKESCFQRKSNGNHTE